MRMIAAVTMVFVTLLWFVCVHAFLLVSSLSFSSVVLVLGNGALVLMKL